MIKIIKRIVFVIILALVIILCARAYYSWRGAPLQLWHTYVPQEMTAKELDKASWADYIKHEDQLFADVRREITDKLPPDAQVPSNRFYEGSFVYPPNLANNWNRSYVLRPEGPVKGAVVFLHGLTDSPYSLRHLARLYAANGFIAYGLRLPGHGTAPSGLTAATWEDWTAATRMAMREAKSSIEPGMPLHIVGFSNGGSLSMKYTLDAFENPELARPDRVVLLSPMIGITRFARFAGFAALPALFPAFEKSAWLSVMTEFNPFKYNSFPVNGARQSHRLTMVVQQQIVRLAAEKNFNTLPPVLTFQSVIDYSVSTPATLNSLYGYLPQNGSELVLFDVNRASGLGSLMNSATVFALNRVMPEMPVLYDLSVITNVAPNNPATLLHTTPAGATEPTTRELDIIYPPNILSLSHGAIPFPMDDPLYGMTPAPGSYREYGVNLGNLGVRGERGILAVSADALFRTSSNPFFSFLQERVLAGINDPMPAPIAGGALAKPAPYSPAVEQAVQNFLAEPDDYNN